MNKLVIEKTESGYALPRNHKDTAKELPEVYYKNGKGSVDRVDRKNIDTWFREARKGKAQAQYNLGVLYFKGVGKIYQQTAIDTHSNVGLAKVHPDKTALTAADFMNDKVLPFFDSENMSLLRILTDRGTEHCGRFETHPYQLFLHLNGIEHSRTKVRHPQTNGSTK